MKYLYAGHGDEKGWLNAPATGEGALSAFRKSYLTAGGFYARAVIYFVVWLALMLIFNILSKQQDANREDRALRQRLKMLAGPGIILYVFVMTFAVHRLGDVSLSPLGLHHLRVPLRRRTIDLLDVADDRGRRASRAHRAFCQRFQKRHLHDLGKLLLAFVMLWAYFDFSQLLIIWSGNQPEEITFYRTRLYGGWGVVAVIVLVFHFFVPFFLLLSQDVKRNAKVLPKIAMWLIFMRLVDLFWMTRPEFTSRAMPTWLDIVVPLALGGLWLGFFAFNLKQRPLAAARRPETCGGH